MPGLPCTPTSATRSNGCHHVISERYVNPFEMYGLDHGRDPYKTPMRIYPGRTIRMGARGLDSQPETDHRARPYAGRGQLPTTARTARRPRRRCRAWPTVTSVDPYTSANTSPTISAHPPSPPSHPAFEAAEKEVRDRIERPMNVKGKQTVEDLHKKLGKIMWDYCGMARNEQGLNKALGMIRELKSEFWSDVRIPGAINEFNPELDKAGCVADFIELGELMVQDALYRKESCGGHFREESQTEDGEAKRDDENFSYVAAWEYTGDSAPLPQRGTDLRDRETDAAVGGNSDPSSLKL